MILQLYNDIYYNYITILIIDNYITIFLDLWVSNEILLTNKKVKTSFQLQNS